MISTTLDTNSYRLYENDIEIYNGEENRFERHAKPGTEFCYTVKATWDFGLEGKLSTESCTSAKTQKPRDISIEVFKRFAVMNCKLTHLFSL